MARYWQAKTFLGYYIEGRNQERSLTDMLIDGIGEEARTEEIMGAGIYIWFGKKADPSLRVKDIGDRTLIELVHVERSLVARRPKPATAPPVEGIAAETDSETEPTEVLEEVTPLEVLPPELENLRLQVEGILSGRHTLVEETPAEFRTQIDLKLQKWERPRPMAIVTRGTGGGDIDLEGTSVKRVKSGGLGGMIVMLFVVVGLGGLGYYLVTNAANDPYYVFDPGTRYETIGSAIGYITTRNQDLVIIKVPTRLDTLWAGVPRFVRAEEDTVTARIFVAEEIQLLRVEDQTFDSVILEPEIIERQSTATELDLTSLVWNRSEVWEEWFRSEIGRGLVRGSLIRENDAIWLVSGENKVQLTVWELLSDEEQIALRFAEDKGRPVLLEVRFQQTLPLRTVRTSASRRLFQAEVRQVTLLEE
jgi:hypothetical protein